MRFGHVTIDDCREKFKSYLVKHNLRMTGQRMAIFEAVFKETSHFTAEELLDKAREIDRTVSRATVYRSLPILVEGHLVREVDIGSSTMYYMPNTEEDPHKAQVICNDCQKIFEISAPFLQWYGNSVSGKLGLTPISQRLQVTASCEELKATGVCKKGNEVPE
ncbi:Fur family transcriptional regulator [Pelagicoccus mobilis]|uniref:Fur family transcriptional regulator n=1 Tax=Pelagicoccus mobilis TaxID=415221 RepID=UPI001F1EC69B|nr:transcriptional repressor [Pelagicoccus mobilis]